MQSDPRIQEVIEAVAPGIRPFTSALAAAVGHLRRFLGTDSGDSGAASQIAAELGEFAAGRIAPERFAPFANWGKDPVNPQSLPVLRQALDTLTELASRGNELFVADVPSGGSLWHSVSGALAEIGRGFSAARCVEAARRASDGNPREVPPPGPLSFRDWGKRQRQLAPPLVVQVDGSDLRVSGLAEFLDGRQKLVLVVRGESAPAPLVRLISPGTFVLQTTDLSGMDRMVAWAGPGIAALLPAGAACFVHDPAGGPALANRLQVTHLPAEAPRKPLGGISAAQQAEELRQLADLTAVAAGAANGAGRETPSDPVERLAAWLIRQANVA